MLLALSKVAQVGIRLQTKIDRVVASGIGFDLVLDSGESLSCQTLVVATGGLSIPTMGASPFGYQLAAQFGLSVLPTRAGLVPFTLAA